MSKKNKNVGSSNSNSDSTIDPELIEIMKEAKKNGWGKPQKSSNPRINTIGPMLRQTSISELPQNEWAESEVLQATMGSDEDETPSYSPEVADFLSEGAATGYTKYNEVDFSKLTQYNDAIGSQAGIYANPLHTVQTMTDNSFGLNTFEYWKSQGFANTTGK